MSIRKCEVMQEIAYLPGYPNNWQETLESNLEKEENIKNWAYIIHDKDTEEETGKLKPTHIHLILELKSSAAYGTVGNYVGVPAQYVQKIKQSLKKGKRYFADIGGALSYLTHRNAKDKYQYSDEDVVAKADYNWKAVRKMSEEMQAKQRSLTKALNDIENGTLREYNLFGAITMGIYIDNKQDIERAFDYRRGVLKMSTDRNIEVIYISGESGAGKTTLAKKICEKRQYSYCISGSSRDPLQDYAGQDALILDDLRPTVLPLSDLLKLLDNYSASSASARYHDRWLEVHLIIVTTVLSINEFFALTPDNGEPIQQLKRRCRTMIVLTHEEMQIYEYREGSQDYMLVGHCQNPIPQQYNTADNAEKETAAHILCNEMGVTYAPDALAGDYEQ